MSLSINAVGLHMFGTGQPYSRAQASTPKKVIFFRHLAMQVLTLFLALGCATPLLAQNPTNEEAETVEFNTSFLIGSVKQDANLSRFSHGNSVSPGEYILNLYLNGNWLARKEILFVETGNQVTPCFDLDLLKYLNINTEALSKHAISMLANLSSTKCVALSKLIDGASYTFELSDLRLDVSLPQSAMKHTPQGYINPEFWDEGVSSATLAYSLNHYRTQGIFSNSSTYLGIDAGINVGTWHFRQRSAISQQSNAARQYQNISTYVQHDIPGIRGQLIIGDSYTDGRLFDSVSMRGVQLISDDRMLPESQRGYAPTIHGIARSNARVSVTQNGVKLYETTVPPGPFDINDLYATGYGGDLNVTVDEADGSSHYFSVPFASVSQLLRPKMWRYSLVTGRVQGVDNSSQSNILQGSVHRGFSSFFTAYAGGVAVRNYNAALVGSAFNTPIGAVSLDVTQSRFRRTGAADDEGKSIRLGYSKYLIASGTSVTMSLHRNTSQGFWSLRDVLNSRVLDTNNLFSEYGHRERKGLQLSISQNLSERAGSLYLTASSTEYWRDAPTARRSSQLQVGYSNSVSIFGQSLTFNLAASRQRQSQLGSLENNLFASVSFPLGSTGRNPAMLSVAMNDDRGRASQQMTLSGSALEKRTLSYGLNVARVSEESRAGGNVQYRGPYATVSANASSGAGYSQVGMGLRGALVAHPAGITLANELGDTIGIVEAKDAKGAYIANAVGVRVDDRGYAVIPYLTPYALNPVILDPKGLPLDVELKETSTQIAPRANSVTMIRFRTAFGRSAMIRIRLPNGASLPFGAVVSTEDENDVGIIGQGGLAFIRGVNDAGTLQIRWGKQLNERCTFHYQLPPSDKKATNYPMIDALCVASEIASARVSKSKSFRY